MSDIVVGQNWRHKERGSIYEIVSVSARIQCSTIDGSMRRMPEGETWIAYRDIRGEIRGVENPLCFRMRDEFLDGRFELVS